MFVSKGTLKTAAIAIVATSLWNWAIAKYPELNPANIVSKGA